MTILQRAPTQGVPTGYPEGFAALDEAHRLHAPTEEDIARYGRYALQGAILLETPADVLAAGEILTNPSQIEKIHTTVDGVVGEYDFAYFRREPISEHLGKTSSVPYLIMKGENGLPRLVPFDQARTLEGEDPRVMRGVRLRGKDGIVRSGWCVSTVIATAKPDNPVDVDKIEQVFYWGETLGMLEPVLRVPNLKNTCLYPVAASEDDTRLDVFGRPHPHISYCRVNDLSEITEELINRSLIITGDLLPPDTHCGVNLVKGVAGESNTRELDIHEACAPMTAAGKVLHYRLGRYVFRLPSADAPNGLLIPFTFANRGDFPAAEPKPPENGVADYTDILYGSMGTTGSMLTGVSDRHIGFATVVRVA
ncbi:MAG TPA: hypothetical protein VLF40_01330 [Candidatus Saccharimonadales bacterium]|nr:hypothetical protein [Candidatus Saccharimonadales bacterium]